MGGQSNIVHWRLSDFLAAIYIRHVYVCAMFGMLRQISRGLRQRRAVITGIGVVSPAGIGIERAWGRALSGRATGAPIHLFDASTFPSQIAAQVDPGFDPREVSDDPAYRREIRSGSRGLQFACAAFILAQRDAGIDHFEKFGTHILVGSAQIDLRAIDTFVRENETAFREYVPGADPRDMLKSVISLPASSIARLSGVEGETQFLSSACITGFTAISNAAARIISGSADTVISGGGDTVVTPSNLHAFSLTRMLSTENGEPEKAMRPFNHDRGKPYLGEGWIIVILEELQHARDRGARIYAEVVPGAQSSENIKNNAKDKTGRKWANVVNRVVGRKDRIDVINTNAVGEHADYVEARVLRKVFGTRAARSIPVTNSKPLSGTSMAAASAFQVALTAKMIHSQEIPPVPNFEKTGNGIGKLNVVSLKSLRKKIREVIVLGYGIGGLASAIRLRKV